MKTFLIAVAGVIVGLVLVVALGFFWLKRKIRGIGDALAAVFSAGAVSPFRVSLRPAGGEPWNDAAAIDAATRSFEAAGYEPAGDYEIPEMEGVAVRGFWHSDTQSFAALTDHPQAPVFADLVRLFRDRTGLTVTTAPRTGMDHPPYLRRERLELDITALETAGQLHEHLVELSAGREPVRKQARSFADAFVSMYAMEMNWRIERGGVTDDEVRRAAAVGGLDAPDAGAICLVKKAWSSAIEIFVNEQVQKAFLDQGGMSASDWEEKRELLAIVHEQGDREERISELAGVLCEAERTPGTNQDDEDDDDAYDAAVARITPAFEGRTIREGFAAAQALMPEKARFEAIGSVEQPWPADFYLVPNLYEGS